MGLRVVLVSSVFFSVNAARSSLNMDRFGSMFEKLGSLLQSHGYADATVQSLAAQAITPGAKASLNEALGRVITQLEENVNSKIKKGHDDTQVAITDAIKTLQTSTKTAVEKKGAADNDDKIWVDCVEKEKAAAEAIETARGEKQQAEAAVAAPCKLQEDRKHVSMTPDANQLKFECNISTSGNCDSQLAKYKTQINSMMSGMKVDVAGKVKSWTEAKTKCTAAKTEVTSKTKALEDKEKQWATQRETCKNNHATRVMSMCVFGTKLKMKCTEVTNYQDLIKTIDTENGDENSHPDRVKEWKTVEVTKCMLREIIDGKDLDAAALSQCEAQSDAASFAKSVGVLDKQGDAFKAETTTAKFTCSEKTSKFHGQTWDMPATEDGSEVASAAYVKRAYEPALDLWGTPFEFCNTETELCKQHTCKFGKVKKRNFVCAAKCTDDECC